MNRHVVLVSLVFTVGAPAALSVQNSALALPSSCWGRNTLDLGAKPQRGAPTVVPPLPTQTPAPATVAKSLLARFGDARYVTGIKFASPPPVTRHHKGYFKTQPPKNALWANVATTIAGTPESAPDAMLRGWEIKLVEGGLRDDLCAAGGRPLVGWSLGAHIDGVSDLENALDQSFPNPSPDAFRAEVDSVGKQYGFTVVSLTLLQPLQLAPALVVQTDRDRNSFVRDVGAIIDLLDHVSGHGSPLAFEGMYFEARDANGWFVHTENVWRGEVEGGQGVASGVAYPFNHG